MSSSLAVKAGRLLKRLNSDQRGADMVEYILVIALIALPLLAVVIWFWKDIKAWAVSLWESNKSSATEGMPS